MRDRENEAWILSELEEAGLEPLTDEEVINLALSILSNVFVGEDEKHQARGFDPTTFIPGRLVVTHLRKAVEKGDKS